MEDKKICFSDLSLPLKVLVILCWIIVGLYGLSFTIGFLSVFLGA